MRFPRDPHDRRQRLLDPDPRLPRERMLDPDPKARRRRDARKSPRPASQGHFPLPVRVRSRLVDPDAAGREILADGRQRSAFALDQWQRNWLAADGISALRTVGTFSPVDFADLVELFDTKRRARNWLRELSQDGLLRTQRFRRAGRRIEALTLTTRGRRLLERSIDPRADGDEQAQTYSSSPACASQIVHDTAVYRAARREMRRISEAGGTVLGVRSEAHLRRIAMRRLNRARLDGRDTAAARAEIAAELHLPLIDSKLRIPDARIEYRPADPAGQNPSFIDVEVATPHYDAHSLSVKAQAGCTIYAVAPDGSLSRQQD